MARGAAWIPSGAFAVAIALAATSAQASGSSTPPSTPSTTLAIAVAGVGMTAGVITIVGGGVTFGKGGAGWRVAGISVGLIDLAAGSAIALTNARDADFSRPAKTARDVGIITASVGFIDFVVGVASAVAASRKPAESAPGTSSPASAPAPPAESLPDEAPELLDEIFGDVPPPPSERRPQFSAAPFVAPGERGEIIAGISLQCVRW